MNLQKQEKQLAIKRARNDVNSPKGRLIEIMLRLDNAGAEKEADGLGKIIGRLERWQNTIGRSQ
jgi:hypothetical protein